MIERCFDRLFQIALVAIAALGINACAKTAPKGEAPDDAFSYTVSEGKNLNSFVLDRNVAAHLLLRSGHDPRIVVAFPAGNSGVGVWFDHLDQDVAWRLDGPLESVIVKDPKGRPLYGVRFRASVDASHLSIKQGVLSNIRYLRDYQAISQFPPEVTAAMTVQGRSIFYQRDRLDGAPGYELKIDVLEGRISKGAILAPSSGRISLEILAASGDTPLTPFNEADLLNEHAADDPAARNALRFLAYREKFLAGSWRFNTYFGRDTLMSVQLLMPVLQPAAVEAGLNAVLARLSPSGEVAHEEGVSEFAVREHVRDNLHLGDTATLDYGMIDGDYMLAPVMGHYLLDNPEGRERALAYLNGQILDETGTAKTEYVGDALVRNMRHVIEKAIPFAADPKSATLVSIKSGRATGEWRDSEEGLGGGRYPYDVNAVFIPAALSAIAKLYEAGMLDRYLTSADREAFAKAGAMASVWREHAPPLFSTTLDAGAAKAAISTYAASLGVDAGPALAAVGEQQVSFHAVSLDAAGAPVPVMNSDEGFALLFGDPPAADLDAYVAGIMRPFPAGLMTDIGLLVANPVYASPEMQSHFTKNHYHGAVVWSWQQATLAAGIERQLKRADLPADVRDRLSTAQKTLWTAIKAARDVQSSELWSWDFKDGHFVVVPFGADSANVDESNAAQLWSTVYLAVQPPK